MKKPLLAAAILISLSGCDLFTIGGPCNYEDRRFKATIVSIAEEKIPSRFQYNQDEVTMGYDVKVKTNIPGQDTLQLEEMVEQTITDEFLKQHELEEGTVLRGVATIITSGTCAPGGYRFSDSTLNAR